PWRRPAASIPRRAAPRRVAARAPRRLPATRAVARARGGRHRAGAAAVAALALAVLVWIFWPASPPPVPTTSSAAPVPAQKATTSREPRKTAPRRAVPGAKPTPEALDEARVRAAILARAPRLSSCPLPPRPPT